MHFNPCPPFYNSSLPIFDFENITNNFNPASATNSLSEWAYKTSNVFLIMSGFIKKFKASASPKLTFL
jgi:hypothetical protein